MCKKYKIILWILIALAIFSLGYYLRAYNSIYRYLPGSPYEIFTSNHVENLLNTGQAVDYTDKATRYPVSQILGMVLGPILGNLYLVYILGAIVIFFLGKEISKSNFGGFIAFSTYAFAGENLLAYMTKIGTSGLCYVFMWAGLLFFLKYLNNKKTYEISLFLLFSILALTTYHTGATAMVAIIVGMLVSLFSFYYLNKDNSFDKKIIFSFVFIILFYIAWIKLFDPSQFTLMINSFGGTSNLQLIILFFCGLFAVGALFLIRKIKFLDSEYLPLIATVLSGFLIFSKLNLFGWLLNFGVSNYYVSNITLNNYIAQFLILHIYLLLFIGFIFKKDNKQVFLLGWLIGLGIVLVGLVNEGYLARIMDYSFPLCFVLFGLYWVQHKKFRSFLVPLTLILLVCSQLIIFNDPFSMRRYYNKNEVESVKNIVALGLNGNIASDLRTSALFSYFGKKGVLFGKEDEALHKDLFYEPDKIAQLADLKINYIVLSENMKTIVHGMNFPTKPVNSQVFYYYEQNFDKIYSDGLMMVYKIK